MGVPNPTQPKQQNQAQNHSHIQNRYHVSQKQRFPNQSIEMRETERPCVLTNPRLTRRGVRCIATLTHTHTHIHIYRNREFGSYRNKRASLRSIFSRAKQLSLRARPWWSIWHSCWATRLLIISKLKSSRNLEVSTSANLPLILTWSR